MEKALEKPTKLILLLVLNRALVLSATTAEPIAAPWALSAAIVPAVIAAAAVVPTAREAI